MGGQQVPSQGQTNPESQQKIIEKLVQRVEYLEQTKYPQYPGAKYNRRGQNLNVECFNCHEMGHFARDCPKKSSPNRITNPGASGNTGGRQGEPREPDQQQAGNNQHVPLNYQGPALAAKGRSD